jgi:copper transport protein
VRRLLCLLVLVAGTLVVPAAAFAHAALLHTVPDASETVNVPPKQVELTFSEAVEPRFAVVSVTDAVAHQETTGPPERSPTNADTLVVPLKHLPEGWYLVYWRAISVDGHPVRGAFTFAVGPNEGPAPQFVIPSISETAATPRLLIARWAVFLSLMCAIGLAALRLAVARPVVRRVPGTSLKAVSVVFGLAAAVGLLAIPVYLVLSTADFALRPWWQFGAIVPLVRVSAFGRGLVDLWIVFALFTAAAGVAIAVDRPEREKRSVAELVSLIGAVLSAAAVLLVPGLIGHAAQTAPRGLSVALDWLHLAGGSLWIGGLVGLLVLWWGLASGRRVAGLAVAVPRFSNTALVSVLVVIGSGVGAAIIHLPTIASLWETSYGQAILWKVGLLTGALLLASVNLLRNKNRLGNPETGAAAARLLRGLVLGEGVLVAAAIFAAAVLSSLPPPSKALAEVGGASAHVGPGAVTRTVMKDGYRFDVRVTPNKAAVPNAFEVRVTRNGKPVTGGAVFLTFAMLDMEMGTQEYRLTETAPGIYSHAAPALVMVGHWALGFQVTPPGASGPVNVLVVDTAHG